MKILFALSLALGASAAKPARVPPTMPTDAITRGQRGVCYTVFAGDTIEPMAFEVRGTMPHFLGPQRHLLLIRLLGEQPEFTGVAAGMSGSPCLIDGRVIGALSYSFGSFAKEPIAGVTPIDDMLALLSLPAESLPWRRSAPGAPASGEGEHAASTTDEQDWQAMAAGTAAPHAVAATAAPVPIATPLSLGGFSPALVHHLAPYLAGHNFVVGSGAHANASKAVAAPVPLQPGAAVAAVLVSGDVSMAGTGTVSWVDGNQLLAFGHPFQGSLGAVSMPMAHATIINTLASAANSFKMAAPGAIVGEFTQDRLSAISGTIGGRAQMVPVEGVLQTPAGRRSFAFAVVRDVAWTPQMLTMALAAALEGQVDVGSRGTLHLQASLDVAGSPAIVVHSVQAAQRDPSMMLRAAMDVGRAFKLLWDAPYAVAPSASVHVTATLAAEVHEEWIDGVQLGSGFAPAGGTLPLAIALRRENEAIDNITLRLAIPRAYAGEVLEVVAAGGREADALEAELNGGVAPHNRAQMRRVLSKQRLPGGLYVFLVRQQGTHLRHDVEAYANLPPSATALLAHRASHVLRAQALVAGEQFVARAGVVHGLVRVAVPTRLP